MKKAGSADLALMGGSIPPWLFDRMTKLSLPIVESILLDYGKKEFLKRLSDPLWFQSFGAVIGMDWNSSGVTTAVMSALKKSLNPHAKDLGIYVCGGKGKESLQTPDELFRVGEKTGLNGDELAKCSRLTAKVDSTAIQDGFQVYMHYFVVSDMADWSVVQQGMKTETSRARRYHWHSGTLQSFVEEPHTAICGDFQGDILNLVDRNAKPTQKSILTIAKENPDKTLEEFKHLSLPSYKEIQAKDVDLKRLGSILWLAQEAEIQNFEDILLLKGLGPRTLQSLTLVSEVIHGTASRFTDPARFAFAHGGKGGRPFPVPTHVYDQTIATLSQSVEKAKIGDKDKQNAIKKLTELAQKSEPNFIPQDTFESLVQKEKEDAWKYGGRTLHGFSKKEEDGEVS
ncbi:DUF763 domain-containing protein [Cytophagales bacterium LB-30]|uniref:DUF763 domain-containing protein n=1 Tax=Shiella aurantiaca TaxID=3058365 RepID=A0ABT8F577_9BACT|nr:DUF763 domain-containing protein [Shiella aurantiaca]MDN4165533.1 DUF763 domain-containing protein [Shiella aurantiaca]